MKDLTMTNRAVREAVEHAIEEGADRPEIEMMLIEVARDVRHNKKLVSDDVAEDKE